jgi:hypothetical protein
MLNVINSIQNSDPNLPFLVGGVGSLREDKLLLRGEREHNSAVYLLNNTSKPQSITFNKENKFFAKN